MVKNILDQHFTPLNGLGHLLNFRSQKTFGEIDIFQAVKTVVLKLWSVLA